MGCTSWRISEETALFGRGGLISIFAIIANEQPTLIMTF
jgi:hypothetical protein